MQIPLCPEYSKRMVSSFEATVFDKHDFKDNINVGKENNNFNLDLDQFELTIFYKETIKKCQLCKRMASKLIYCCCLQTLDTNYYYRAESMSPLLLS